MIDTIHALSVDFDNCLTGDWSKWKLGNKPNYEKYSENVEEQNQQKQEEEDWFIAGVIHENGPIFRHIENDYVDGASKKELKVIKKICLMGTLRKGILEDYMNRVPYKKEKSFGVSCFPVFKAFFHEASKRSMSVCSIPCVFDTTLLSDIYCDKEPGESYDNALKNYRDFKVSSTVREFSRAVPESSKVDLLYMQFHKIASEHPNAEIIFDFIDDQEDILDALQPFFFDNSDLVPSNVTLRFYQYKAGDEAITLFKNEIKGRGGILSIEIIKENVKTMAMIAMVKDDISKCFQAHRLNIIKVFKQCSEKLNKFKQKHIELCEKIKSITSESLTSCTNLFWKSANSQPEEESTTLTPQTKSHLLL